MADNQLILSWIVTCTHKDGWNLSKHNEMLLIRINSFSHHCSESFYEVFFFSLIFIKMYNSKTCTVFGMIIFGLAKTCKCIYRYRLWLSTTSFKWNVARCKSETTIWNHSPPPMISDEMMAYLDLIWYCRWWILTDFFLG